MSADATAPLSPRRSGLLLHPTSLPSRFGIGDLGPAADAWLRFLAEAGQQVWQVLPLGPTGMGNSPYASPSSFAMNPLLISPARLVRDGLVRPDELPPEAPVRAVDFERLVPRRSRWLQQVAFHFGDRAAPALRAEFDRFCAEEASWLDNWSLFASLRERHEGRWSSWPDGLATRQPAALARAREELASPIRTQQILQFLVQRQWLELRRTARRLGISILGDLPIFPSDDSCDSWTHPELFELDEAGEPIHVAGVPPDYFSETGQRWGNPVYRWQAHADSDYAWWAARIARLLSQVDEVRIDHFRGFAAWWAIPADHKTAIGGSWKPGPGAALFESLRRRFGDLPIVAEDLGIIDRPVEELRDGQGFPGMVVLHFAFGAGWDHAFLPHRHRVRQVVYTGTHDNDTSRGWYAAAPEKERDHLRRYFATDGHDPAWTLMRAAWNSVAATAVAPLQDVLDLGTDARMNVPGEAEGNWTWRMPANALHPARAARLQELTRVAGRLPGSTRD